MKTIDNKELIIALEMLEKEKGIQKEYLLESIEMALVTAYKKNFDSIDNVKVIMNAETGDINVYAVKEIVEVVESPKLQITLEDARKISKKLEIGDTVDIEIIPKDFGRISAQTAKQVVVQKIREAERENIYTQYSDRVGEIVSGIIQRVDANIIVVDLGKLEGIMPTKEQIPTEMYRMNQKVKAYVVGVEKGIKGMPQVILSRSHGDLVRKLFELEIPEIYEGLIEIKSVSRDPGNRCKVAVYSKNPDVDPVGSCVGQKGIRIQNIINELNGEKIDVIEWDPDISVFIAAALLPASVMAVDIKEELKQAQVIVPDEQLSLAIGKAGQNARLAAKLTNWKIDIKSETQFREILQQMQEEAEKEETVEEVVEEEKPKKATRAKKAVETDVGDGALDIPEEKPKKTRKKKEETTKEVVEEKPKKVTKAKKAVETDVGDGALDIPEEKPKRTRKKKEE